MGELLVDVLGPVRARRDGVPVRLGPRLVVLLSALLVEAGRGVPAGRLVELLWDGSAPGAARATLRSHVSHLRRALAPDGGHHDDVVTAVGSGTFAGYRLDLTPEQIDARRFERGYAEGRRLLAGPATEVQRGATLIAEALALWRGPAFAEVADRSFVLPEVARLNALRRSARCDHARALAAMGRHAEVIGDMSGAVAEDPYDEELRRLLALALYAEHRADEAAEVCREGLTLLLDRGIEAPMLQELQRAILLREAATGISAIAATSVPSRPRTPAEGLGAERGERATQPDRRGPAGDPSAVLDATGRPAPGPQLPLAGEPRQLPAAPGLFCGRARELVRLTAVLSAEDDPGGGAVMAWAITGTGGIGKSWLALRWAHDNLARFPDGQLYVDLRGFDPSGDPLSPSVAIRGLLDALVDPAAEIPTELDAQVGLYRSLVAGRRMLIMLDNARDSAQVTPLLPGSASCTVLITSRHRLAGLVATHGVRPLPLDVLDAADAHQLLERHLGPQRVAAEPEAVTDLLDLCAGLPLALGIVAARAATQPDFPLAVLADELRKTETRLDALNLGDVTADLRAVFSSSYRALPTRVAEVFGLLGMAPGPDISLPAAASLIAASHAHTRGLLQQLGNAHLVQEYTPGRYRLHDLVRVYAVEVALDDQPRQARREALRRLTDFYLHTAYAGDRVLEPHRQPIEIGQPTPGCVPDALESRAAAMAWFNAEYPCLRAAQRLAADQGWHTAVCQLAWVLGTFHYRRGRLEDNLTMWTVGLASADAADDPNLQALVHRLLGEACARVDKHTEALDHLQEALVLTDRIGDAASHAWVLRTLAWLYGQQGGDRQALAYATQALNLCRQLGNPVREAEALNAVGWYHGRLGHYDSATAFCEQALDLFQRHHNDHGRATALDSLGYLARRTGQHARALTYYQQAVHQFHSVGNAYEAATTLVYVGDTHHALDQHAEAREAWQQALDLFGSQHRAEEAGPVREKLSALIQRASLSTPPQS
ncbi:AfsR/SARP family transcriptional regulator [Planosporangium sp. 12N6]|uniref:AfsR/SARP family transcriptional regulator n=1 Tax=Planosporangium spinosum TaxID=3402278 RepID=UPI003CF56F65